MNHDDLTVVREFRAALDEPRDGALAKGRWQLASGGGPERPRPRRPWALATAGAALAVAVVVGGGAAVVHLAAPRHEDPVVPGQSAAPGAPSPSVVDLPVTQGTKAPLRPAVTGKAGGTHAAAVEALTRLAGKVTDGPLQVGADQVLYVKTYNLQDGAGLDIHELWLEPSSGVALRIRRTFGALKNIDNSLTAAEVAEATAQARLAAPGLDNMTVDYVTAFPAGAAHAHELAASWRAWAREAYPGRETDGMIWKQLHEVLHYVDPLLNAQQRAALYLAMADLPAARATTASIGGKQYDVLCMSRPEQFTDCYLFDPATGRYAGDASPGSDSVLQADNFSFVDTGVQPRPAPGTQPPVTQTKAPAVGGSTPTPRR